MKHTFYYHFSSWPNRKNEAEEPGSLRDLLSNPMWSGINRETWYKVHWILSVIPSMREIMVCRAISMMLSTGTYYFVIVPLDWSSDLSLPLGWFFSMHPSHFSWILFLPNRSDCLPSWVFLGHQAKCHTHAKLFIIDTYPQPCSNHMLYHYDLYFMDSKTTFTVRHDIILRPLGK